MERPHHILRALGAQNHCTHEYEQDEISYAIALSLSEEDQNLQKLIRKQEDKIIKAQIEEDEKIAMALQESLIMASSSTNDCKKTPRTYANSPERICGGCNTKIGCRREHILDSNGTSWHEECLLCHACRQLITDDELYMFENRPYHISCHRKKGNPKCYVCNNFIPNSNDVVDYGEHPFWGQKYCPSHEDDGTSKCYSCERLVVNGKKHIPLKDGRELCSECCNFAIMDAEECQPLLHEIQEFFKSLHMKVDQQIPLLLVQREALNEAMEAKNNGHHHSSETRGLCLSEEQTIPTRLKTVRTCEVTAILILYGLPRLLTGSILAHEMMHAWLRLNGYPNLEAEVEEGICQVLAHRWLKSQLSNIDIASSSSSSSLPSRCSNKHKLTETERKLGECFIRQIELDASSAYGDGFRVGLQAVSQYGLRSTLDHIKHTTTFPIISTFM